MLHSSLNNNSMKILLTLISILMTSGLFSQVTVNSMSLPDVGDELDYTVFAEYQDTVSYRMSGEDMEWTFDGFNAVNSQTEVFTDISTTSFRDSFPDANMLLEFGGRLQALPFTSAINTISLVSPGAISPNDHDIVWPTTVTGSAGGLAASVSAWFGVKVAGKVSSIDALKAVPAPPFVM